MGSPGSGIQGGGLIVRAVKLIPKKPHMQAAMMAKLPAIMGSLFLLDELGRKGFPHNNL